MPVLTTFYGIVITMNFDDHNPPHFHARHAEFSATFDFDGNLTAGKMPRSKIILIQAWASLHKEELEADWFLASNRETVARIDPLK